MKAETHFDAAAAARVLAQARRAALEAAGYVVENRIKQLLSVAGTGQKAGKGGKSKRSYGANPSRPGQAPHKQRGRLRSSITHVVEGDHCLVGTPLKYGLYLEMGTTRMAARPFLRRGLHESRPQITQLLRSLSS